MFTKTLVIFALFLGFCTYAHFQQENAERPVLRTRVAVLEKENSDLKALNTQLVTSNTDLTAKVNKWLASTQPTTQPTQAVAQK